MKRHFFLTSCAMLVAFAVTATAEEATNRYDLLGQVLEPLTAVFMPEYAGKAFAATLVLDTVPGFPPEWRGQEARLVFQPPRMAKISATVRGKEWALCRVRGELWGTPRDEWAAFAKQFSQKQQQKRGPGLPDFALPFSPQQLVFLPVLFQVDDDGLSPTGARVLKVRLAPTIAEGLQGSAGSSAKDLGRWSARLTVREVAGARPRLERIELSQLSQLSPGGWRFAADVRRWSLVRNVPASFWQPNTRSGDAAFRFSGAEARGWWSGAWHQWLNRR